MTSVKEHVTPAKVGVQDLLLPSLTLPLCGSLPLPARGERVGVRGISWGISITLDLLRIDFYKLTVCPFDGVLGGHALDGLSVHIDDYVFGLRLG